MPIFISKCTYLVMFYRFIIIVIAKRNWNIFQISKTRASVRMIRIRTHCGGLFYNKQGLVDFLKNDTKNPSSRFPQKCYSKTKFNPSSSRRSLPNQLFQRRTAAGPRFGFYFLITFLKKIGARVGLFLGNILGEICVKIIFWIPDFSTGNIGIFVNIFYEQK